jgi:hypothetical protein
MSAGIAQLMDDVRRLLRRRTDVDRRAEDRTAGAWSLSERLRRAERTGGATVYYTPALIAAHAVSCPRPTDSDETAYWHAVRLFQDENIWLVSRWHEGRVYYVAAPGRRFSPDGDFAATPLAQALPGHPMHRGDHGYLTQLDDGHFGVLLVRGNGLSLMLGTETEVRAFAGDRGSTVVIADLAAAEEWIPFQLAQTRYRQRIGMAFALSGAVAAAAAALAIFGATLWQGILLEDRGLIESQSANYTRALEQQLSEAVRQPLLQHVSRMQKLRGLKLVLGDNAYLVRYEVKPDGRWIWTAVVPDWANTESLRPFGTGIRLSAAPGRPGFLLATLQGDG